MNVPLLRIARLPVTCSRFVMLTVLCLLAFPAAAQAHSGSSVIAVDYEARPTRSEVTPGVRARVIDGNRKLELAVLAPHSVVVIGYGGEPFLRFDRVGVSVNERSLTAVTNKLTLSGATPELENGARPRWRLIAYTHRFAWHDHRLALAPALRAGTGRVADWSVPLVVDGKALRVEGGIWHKRGPSLWPWLVVLAAVVLAGSAVACWGTRRLRRGAAYGSAAFGGVAFLVASFGFAFAPSTGGTWASLALPLVVAMIATAVFVFRPHLRYAVAGVVGLLVVVETSGEVVVFGHGYVISVLPTGVARLAVAAAIGAGLVTTIVVMTGLLREDDGGGRRSTSRKRPSAGPRSRLAIPKGRPR